MDERTEERFTTALDATITDLEHPGSAMPGRIANISGSGICLVVAVDLAPGTILKLEVAGSALFGHVVYSNLRGGDFHAGVEVTRVLFGENDLSRLLRAVIAAEMPGVATSTIQ